MLRADDLERRRSKISRVLLDHAASTFILAQSRELRMPEMVDIGPFEKLNLRDDFRADPNAFLHLLSGQSLAPSRLPGFGQIHKWALRNDEWLQFLE